MLETIFGNDVGDLEKGPGGDSKFKWKNFE